MSWISDLLGPDEEETRFHTMDAYSICELYETAIQQEDIELRKEIRRYTYNNGWLPTYDETSRKYKCQSS